ncbi:uncharacterized protein LOC129732949 [Wyeomyia smithii]|uniref:uncharacterized protein LOC129732949 n=1 Tax=Wyeomyia smithii TaxID=174621 RepID=UPI002467B5E7|nr:uncharacterized protein LOC129732949 [Wyeomyia smithii]
MDDLSEQQEQPDEFQLYLDHCFEQICNTELVRHAIILSKNGIPLRSTFGDRRQECLDHVALYSSLYDKARYVTQLVDPSDECLLVTVKTKHNEAVIAVDPENELLFITVQVPQ